MNFAYTDTSDDRLTVELGVGVDGMPVIAVTAEQHNDVACVHVPLDHVEEVVAGIRDTARQTAAGSEQLVRAEPGDRPRLFHLQRDHDVSGVSGTGRVANGVLWPDGTVSLRWIGERPSTVSWDRLADAEAVHGHGGATRIVWADQQPPAPQTGLDGDTHHRLDDGSTHTHTHTAITNAGEACLMHACRAALEETRLRQEQYSQAAAIGHLADEIRDLADDGQIPADAATRLRELIAAAAQNGGQQ